MPDTVCPTCKCHIKNQYGKKETSPPCSEPSNCFSSHCKWNQRVLKWPTESPPSHLSFLWPAALISELLVVPRISHVHLGYGSSFSPHPGFSSPRHLHSFLPLRSVLKCQLFRETPFTTLFRFSTFHPHTLPCFFLLCLYHHLMHCKSPFSSVLFLVSQHQVTPEYWENINPKKAII